MVPNLIIPKMLEIFMFIKSVVQLLLLKIRMQIRIAL